MHADQFASSTGVTGAGVTIGVMSDDITNAAAIQARGELPAVQDFSTSAMANSTPTDEGTVMLEEVHAVAPGATLAFCGPQTGQQYLSCLASLMAGGATVVVDDLVVPGEDLMSGSSAFAQAVQSLLATNPNVLLFTVTDNYNGSYWEGPYAPASLASLGYGSFTCLSNGQVDNYLEGFGGQYGETVTVGAAGTYNVTFQWADPYGQNASNFDLYFVDAATSAQSCVGVYGTSATELTEPVTLAAGTYYFFIGTPDASLSGKQLKLLLAGDGATQFSVATPGSVVSPQAFVPGVFTVGAVDGSDGIGNLIEYYSGRGPVSLEFPTPVQMQAPDAVAPDAVYVDAAGTNFSTDAQGNFHGTSAASPNAAAVAALIRSAFPSLTPTDVTNALQSGATVLSSSVDGTFGYGRIDAMGALSTLPSTQLSGWSAWQPNTIVGGTSSPAYPFTVTGTGALHFWVTSTDPTVIPDSLVGAGQAGVTISPANCGTGATSCTAAFTPAIGQTGAADVTIWVADGAGRTASVHSPITVVTPPSPTIAITSGGSQSVNVSATLSPVVFTLAGTGPLTVTETTNGVSQLQISAGCGTTSMQCTATLGNAASTAGTETLTINAADSYGQVTSAQATFNVTQPPSASGGGGGGGAVDLWSVLGLAGLLLVRLPKALFARLRQWRRVTWVGTACLALVSLGLEGCATPLTTYKPSEGQIVNFDQGVGSITDDEPDYSLVMYPTFRYQSPSDLPTFTLMVVDHSQHSIDFDPAYVRAFLDDQECHVYTLEQRVNEIHRKKVQSQVALAVVGALAAGAAGYAASHQTTTYNSYGYVGYHPVMMSGTMQTYDPAARMLAGAAVGAATGVGIHQLENAAAHEEQAAQAIFQHSTVAPGSTVAGQLVLKPSSANFGTLRVEIPIGGRTETFSFVKTTTTN